ncbi:hypothetical protein PhCBS80983_g01385 [Powellomyces hirtus]|uniref:Protein phosphatase inhibitor 2 n=1 Tax=Powellomyces hirtus TaxID=109895 RepID=A0A507EBF9_9FUNG|nr:hypothetical protein PhCBS80983_g01385 [Powellomyces hirtus]
MPKGILKHSADAEVPTRGIKWDEDNLMITEAQKGGTMKIDEPKTPYIRYDSANDMLLGSTGSVPPMELSTAIDNAKAQQQAESVAGNEAQDATRQRRVSVDEWDDDADEENMDPEELEKHRKFEALRASHYNMKAALKGTGTRKGRDPSPIPTATDGNDADDNDDDEDEDDKDNDDTDNNNDEQESDPLGAETFDLEMDADDNNDDEDDGNAGPNIGGLRLTPQHTVSHNTVIPLDSVALHRASHPHQPHMDLS